MACVTFTGPELLAGFEEALGLPFPVLGDPGRIAYRTLGLGRAPWRRVWLDPRVWWRYVTLLARGRRLRAGQRGQDVRQLGGDVVLDAAGRVAWLYRSAGPEDRPPVGEVVEAVRRAARGG